MKKAVIFDFDGTLADTLPLVFHCFRTVLGEYGDPEVRQHTLTDADILKLFGPTEIQILNRLVPTESAPSAIATFLDLYEQHHTRFVKPYPDIASMLERLQAAGVKLAVFTGKGRPTYEISIRQLGMQHFFAASFTGDDVKQQKPDAEGLLAALQALDVAAADAVMVGDSNGDMMAAQAAGIDSVAVNWLGTSQTTHFHIQPTLRVNAVADFMEWLGVNLDA